MEYVHVEADRGIVTLTLSRGKVNALNGDVVDQLRRHLERLESDRDVRALVLTGRGSFFSFGFDIPELRSAPEDRFARYLTAFTDLYTYLFRYPKPVVAALNGHTIAGGCMLALACDHRLMVSGKAKIALNEVSFGSTVFAGSTEMLRFWIGAAGATEVLYSGAMYAAEQATALGLVHEVTTEDELLPSATRIASHLAAKPAPAFASIKALLRTPVLDEMTRREGESIREFVRIWYSEATRANLEKIAIREG